MNTRQFWNVFFRALYFLALLVLAVCAFTYQVVNIKSSWEGLEAFKIINLVLLWSFVGLFCFNAFWSLFSRTKVTIKPDGDQENNLQFITIGPFNRWHV